MEPPEPLHEARIAAKRLRYLLEAAREVDPLVPSALQALKAIQDLLGEFHDAEVLGELASRQFRRRVKRSTLAAVEEVRRNGLGDEARRLRRVPEAGALLELVDHARRRRLVAWRAIRRSAKGREELWLGIEGLAARWKEAPAVTPPGASGDPAQTPEPSPGGRP